MKPAPADRRLYAGTALASAFGIASIFLPFTYDTSPWGAVLDRELWMLAAPFFVSVPLGLASVWGLIGRSLTPAGRAVALIGAAIAGLVTLYGTSLAHSENPMRTAAEWSVVLVAPATIVSGMAILWRHSRFAGLDDPVALMTLGLAYIANAGFCLLLFAGEWQSGAYAALASAVLSVSSIAAALMTARSTGPTAASRRARPAVRRSSLPVVDGV